MTRHRESNIAAAPINPDRLLRRVEILGDRKRGIPPIVPVSPSTWERGWRSGRYPAPIKIGERIVVWRARDVLAIADRPTTVG